MEIESPWAFEPTAEGIVGQFAALVKQKLAEWQGRVAVDAGSFGEVETEVLRLCQQMAGPLTVAVLQAPEVKAALSAQAEGLRSGSLAGPTRTEKVTREVRLLCGAKVRIRTWYCVPRRVKGDGRPRMGRRQRAAVGFYPFLAALGIRQGASPGLQDEVGRLSALLPSFELARKELQARGICLNFKTVRRIALELGAAALCARTEQLRLWRLGQLPRGSDLSGKRVVVGIDGGRARTRKTARRGRRTAKGRHRYDTPWREPKLFIIYVIGPAGKLDRSFCPVVDGTLLGPDALMELLCCELHRLGAQLAEQGLFIGDGAEWIWERVPLIIDRLGLRPTRWWQAIDLCHVVGHVASALKSCKNLSDTERKRRLTRLKGLLLSGQSQQVIEALGKLCRGRRSKAISSEIAFLRKRQARLRYGWLRTFKLPLGSGSIESAIRRVLNLRLKGPGIFWDELALEAMLHLRASVLTGRWPEGAASFGAEG